MKIAIIKLGAKGDVVRTLSLLPALKNKHENAEIHWITKDNIADLLEGHPLIDKTYTLPYNGPTNFDVVYNFEIEEEASQVAKKLEAPKKLGFYVEDGFPITYNPGAEYYLNTVFDDELKKANKKTYQQMMCELAELENTQELPKIYLTEQDKEYAKQFAEKNNLQEKKVLGIHMGAGPRWPSKAWSETQVAQFARLANEKNYKIILFGGPDEVGKHEKLISKLQAEGITIYHNETNNTNRQFAALLDLCESVICSDSFAVHVATALNKKTIALFFCTSVHEVEPYNLITKIASPMLYEFFPEKSDQYSGELVNSISAEEVFSKLG